MARTLTRDPGRAVLGGVAAGFGRYLDVDPVLVRLAFVVLCFANGLGLLLYLASWALIPKEGVAAGAVPAGVQGAFAGAREAAEEAARAIGRSAEDAGGARLVIGYGLIALGSLAWVARGQGTEAPGQEWVGRSLPRPEGAERCTFVAHLAGARIDLTSAALAEGLLAEGRSASRDGRGRLDLRRPRSQPVVRLAEGRQELLPFGPRRRPIWDLRLEGT